MRIPKSLALGRVFVAPLCDEPFVGALLVNPACPDEGREERSPAPACPDAGRVATPKSPVLDRMFSTVELFVGAGLAPPGATPRVALAVVSTLCATAALCDVPASAVCDVCAAAADRIAAQISAVFVDALAIFLIPASPPILQPPHAE
ncbi:MAG: hypothetical protein WBE86_14310 [Candidatus Acidiferrales bacterium]